MKNLAKLNGAKALSKKEQKSVNGGIFEITGCFGGPPCPTGSRCCIGYQGCAPQYITEAQCQNGPYYNHK